MNKWFVYEGNILRAAQPTKALAMKYMKKGRRLLKNPLRNKPIKLKGKSKAKYITLLNRASKVTLRTPWKNLNYNEKKYIRQGVDRMLANDFSRGGYGGKYRRYVLKGGKLPDLPK